MPYLDDNGFTRFWAGLKARFAAASHSHSQGQVQGLSDALAGKAATSHGHTQGQIEGLGATLATCVSGQNGTGVTAIDNPNKIYKSGFYEIINSELMPDLGWFWVIMAGHTSNASDYHYGQLIACRVSDGAIFTTYRSNKADEITAARWKQLYKAGEGGLALAEVAGLADELSRRVNKAAPVIEPGTDLNTIVDSGFYRLRGGHVNLPANAGDGQMVVSRGADTIAQIVIPYSSRRMYYRSGNPPDVGGAGTWSEWRRLYQEGDLVLVRKMNTGLTVPTTGWTYHSADDMYYQQFNVSGAIAGGDVYVDCELGGNFPLIAARCFANNTVMLYMADVPTISLPISLRFTAAI